MAAAREDFMQIDRTVTRLLAVLGLALAASAAHAASTGDPPAYGRSADDLAMEEFLRNAEVVSSEEVGVGITNPLLLVLQSGERQHRAIFKTVDIELDEPARTDRLEHNFTDKYAYEAATYRLDRLLGIGLVPVAVVREIDGRPGSVQYWVENVTTLEEAMENPDVEVANFDLLVQRLLVMYVIDALIYNIDRNYGNVLVNLDEDVFHPIDHSRAFRLHAKPPPVNAQTDQPLPIELVDAMRALTLENLDAALGDLIDEAQVRAVLKRRDRLLKMLRREGLLPTTG
jgi:hypothetical protein